MVQGAAPAFMQRCVILCIHLSSLPGPAGILAVLDIKPSAVLPVCVTCSCCSLQNGVVLKEGDFVSLNGVTGEVIKGAQPVKKPAMTGDLGTFMKWVDAKRRLRVLTNAGEGREDGESVISQQQ